MHLREKKIATLMDSNTCSIFDNDILCVFSSFFLLKKMLFRTHVLRLHKLVNYWFFIVMFFFRRLNFFSVLFPYLHLSHPFVFFSELNMGMREEDTFHFYIYFIVFILFTIFFSLIIIIIVFYLRYILKQFFFSSYGCSVCVCW